MKAGHKSRNLVNVGGFFLPTGRLDILFGRTKEFSEVRGTSLMCNFGVRSRFLDVIYDVRPPNGSPEPTFKLRNSKSCSVSSLTLIEYSSDKQRL